MKLSTKPYTGTKDFIFDDFERLEFISGQWRKVCKQFGFKEYVLPVLEPADVYKAKSGDEIVNEQLYVLKDKAGRELAIRPEATPSIVRVIAKYYNRIPKPIKVFSILNFMRYERPQSGRMREFFQLNVDIFGADNLLADLQLISIALESILVFKPPRGAFRFYINDRHLMFESLEKLGIKDLEQQRLALRFIDKLGKLSESEFHDELQSLITQLSDNINETQVKQLEEFLTILYSTDFSELELSKAIESVPMFKGLRRTEYVAELLSKLSAIVKYSEYVRFNPAIVRGLDYYDGVVFEAFDTHPENKRALLGGGRYNGLGALFGVESMPAVGFGAGNYTLENFLDNWDLWGNNKKQVVRVFVPLLEDVDVSAVYSVINNDAFRAKITERIRHVCDKLNTTDINVVLDISVKEYTVVSSLRRANKLGYDYILFLGEDELRSHKINLKKL